MGNTANSRWAEIREQRLQSPEARERYERTRRVLGTIESLVDVVESERQRAGLSRAALARRIGARPTAVQRLLRSGPSESGLKLLLEMLDALGVQLRLERSTVVHSPSATATPSCADEPPTLDRSPLVV